MNVQVRALGEIHQKRIERQRPVLLSLLISPRRARLRIGSARGRRLTGGDLNGGENKCNASEQAGRDAHDCFPV